MRDVGSLLNAVQDSPAAAERSLQGLVRLLSQSAAEHTPELLGSIKQLLVLDQKHKAVGQYQRFFARLVSSLPSKDAASELLHNLLQELAGHLDAESKHARHQCTHMLVHVLGALPPHTDIAEDLQEQLCSGLVARLHDKQAVIRAAAAQALAGLAHHTQDSGVVEEAVAGILEALAAEKLKAVRCSLVAHLPLTQEALPALVERLQDVEPQVRTAALQKLACLDAATAFSPSQRVSILEAALKDDDSSVALEAQQLLVRWLQQAAGGCPVQLLLLLDVYKHPALGEAVVKQLLQCGALDVEKYTTSAPKPYACPKQQQDGDQGPMEGAAAFLWRYICCWLAEEAVGKGQAAAHGRGTAATINAATAADAHELLDEVLPTSAEAALELVRAHAGAGPQGRFAATQLLHLAAACMDWADAVNGPLALQLVQELLLLDPRAGKMPTAAGSSSSALVGCGGDGSWEAAVVRLLQVASLNGRHFADVALGAVEDMEAAWGLGAQEGGCQGSADARSWRQLLQYMLLLGRRLPRGASSLWQRVAADGSSTAGAVWHNLLLCGMDLEDTTARTKAAEAAVLHALPQPGSTFSVRVVQALMQWLQHLEEPVLAAAAAQGLTDLCLCWGPGAVQAAALAVTGDASEGPHTPAKQQSPAQQDDQAEVGAAAGGVPQLLLVCLSALLDEQVAAMAREAPPRSRKRPAADEAASTPGLPSNQQQLFLVAVEAAAKLVLHHSLWLGKPQQQLPQATVHNLLSMLLLLTFHPATEHLQLRACLGALWETWPAAGPAHRAALAAAGLPAAWRVLELPGRRQLAPLMLAFWHDLLLKAAEAHQGTGGPSDAGLVQQLLMDVQIKWDSCLARGHEVTRYKPYLAALLQVAASLPLQPAPAELQVLRGMVTRLQAVITDKQLQQELDRVAAALAVYEEQCTPAMTEEDVEQLIAGLQKATLEQQQQQQQGAGQAAAAGRAGAARARGRPARGRGARSSRPSRAHAAAPAGSESEGSDGDDDEEEEAPVATGRGREPAAAGGRSQPTRAARSKGVDLAAVFKQETQEVVAVDDPAHQQPQEPPRPQPNKRSGVRGLLGGGAVRVPTAPSDSGADGRRRSGGGAGAAAAASSRQNRAADPDPGLSDSEEEEEVCLLSASDSE